MPAVKDSSSGLPPGYGSIGNKHTGMPAWRAKQLYAQEQRDKAPPSYGSGGSTPDPKYHPGTNVPIGMPHPKTGKTGTGGTGTGGTGGTGTGGNLSGLPYFPGGQGGSSFGEGAYDYIKQLQQTPGMTPEQEQVLRNRIADTHASQRQGSEERLRSQMQRSGLSGTGQETRGLLGAEQANMASLQGALTSQDLANMQMEQENRMKLAGMGVESAKNIDQSRYNYARLAQEQEQYGQDFGWEKYLNDLQKYYYGQQQGTYEDWFRQLMGG